MLNRKRAKRDRKRKANVRRHRLDVATVKRIMAHPQFELDRKAAREHPENAFRWPRQLLDTFAQAAHDDGPPEIATHA